MALLYGLLFINQPSLVKESACCNVKISHVIPFVENDIIYHADFENLVIHNIMDADTRGCPGCGKWEEVRWTISEMGNFISLL